MYYFVSFSFYYSFHSIMFSVGTDAVTYNIIIYYIKFDCQLIVYTCNPYIIIVACSGSICI